MGRVAGPFDVLTPADVILSPLGVVPKKTPGEYRLIHDLSFPKLDSVNSHIEKAYMEVTYGLRHSNTKDGSMEIQCFSKIYTHLVLQNYMNPWLMCLNSSFSFPTDVGFRRCTL